MNLSERSKVLNEHCVTYIEGLIEVVSGCKGDLDTLITGVIRIVGLCSFCKVYIIFFKCFILAVNKTCEGNVDPTVSRAGKLDAVSGVSDLGYRTGLSVHKENVALSGVCNLSSSLVGKSEVDSELIRCSCSTLYTDSKSVSLNRLRNTIEDGSAGCVCICRRISEDNVVILSRRSKHKELFLGACDVDFTLNISSIAVISVISSECGGRSNPSSYSCLRAIAVADRIKIRNL